eukprot:6181976-Pleurochrysis_carterae.AAC.1
MDHETHNLHAMNGAYENAQASTGESVADRHEGSKLVAATRGLVMLHSYAHAVAIVCPVTGPS